MEFTRTIKAKPEEVEFAFNYVGIIKAYEYKGDGKYAITVRSYEKFAFSSIKTLIKNAIKDGAIRKDEVLKDFNDTITLKIKELEEYRNKYSKFLEKIIKEV